VSAVELAIRGGTVVDGSGRPGYRADVGIAAGRVVEIAERVEGADELDASGRLVVPGFIDLHTHYDAQALWDPELSPSSWQGVTSVVLGNCGLSLAPVTPGGRDVLLRTLEKVEDMRMATLQAGIDWDFETYPEYLDAVARRGPIINVGGYVGHTAVRVYVMGDDAAEREATAAEVDAMRRLVAESLAGGALGFSTDRAGFILGAGGRPLPSVVAALDEVEALMRVPDELGRGIVHIAPGDDYQWLYTLEPPLQRPINWSSILAYRPGSTTRLSYKTKLADLAAGRRAGAPLWAQVTCRPIQQQVTLRDPAPFSTVPAFAEVFGLAPEQRTSLYADPAWRGRAVDGLASSSIPVRWDAFSVAESPRSPQLVGRSLLSIAEERECSPFDAMCDVAVGDDLATRFAITFANDDPDAVRELLLGEGAIMGLSDAGAHVSQICDAVLPLDFLGGWVRDREVMRIEDGVRKLTGELADLLGIGRGYLEVGRPADVAVIDFATVGPGPIRRVRDMPAGGERLVGDAPTGLDAVVVNGTPIRRDGAPVPDRLDRRPGSVLRSA
jgi:N-acyl-D-aspartate/D-glutamate deacylase